MYGFNTMVADDVSFVDGSECFADGLARTVDGFEPIVHYHSSSAEGFERIFDGYSVHH